MGENSKDSFELNNENNVLDNIQSIDEIIDPAVWEDLQKGNVSPELEEAFKQLSDGALDFFDPKRRTGVAKDLLEEKYEREFEIVSYVGQKAEDQAYSVVAYDVEFPYMLFEALVSLDESYLIDSYVIKRGCWDIKNIIEQNLNEFKGDVFVHVESQLLFLKDKKLDCTYKDFASAFPKNKYSIHMFFVPGEEKTEIRGDSINKFISNLEGLNGYITLYLVTKEKRSEIIQYIEERPKLYGNFKELTKEFVIGRFSFEKGLVDIADKDFHQEF